MKLLDFAFAVLSQSKNLFWSGVMILTSKDFHHLSWITTIGGIIIQQSPYATEPPQNI